MNQESDALPSKGRYSPRAAAVIEILDARVNDVFRVIQEQPFWRALHDPSTDNETCLQILREVFRSIVWYQKQTTEAGFHMIGRLPGHEETLLKLTLLHKVEEAGHNAWALRDFELLGGIGDRATKSPMSADCFAVAGVWWQMARNEDPFGYFGAEYLFEYLTVIVAQPMVELFKKRALKAEGLRFIIDHATEDIKHAKLIRHLISDIVTRYPESEAAMIRCFDYFRQVYPLPVWAAAYQRAVNPS